MSPAPLWKACENIPQAREFRIWDISKIKNSTILSIECVANSWYWLLYCFMGIFREGVKKKRIFYGQTDRKRLQSNKLLLLLIVGNCCQFVKAVGSLQQAGLCCKQLSTDCESRQQLVKAVNIWWKLLRLSLIYFLAFNAWVHRALAFFMQKSLNT